MQLVLGTMGRQGKQQVALVGKDAASHRHIMGVTGTGKSKFLASQYLQLLNQKIGAILLDPHGDLSDDALQVLWDTGYFANQAAFERLRYIEFSRSDAYPPFNVLALGAYETHAVARNLWEAWSRAWGGLSGGNAPMMEQAVLAGAYVLAENHLPITELQHLYADADFRATLLERVRDANVRGFFHAHIDGRRGSQVTESALRRAFLLTFTPALRYSLGQRHTALPFRELMDQGVSVLVNLGGLDAETQRFLGCLISVGIEQAILSRANIPESARRPYHLFLDEWSMFSAQSATSMERMLALVRKFGLTLTLAHQTWGQASGLQSALQNACFITFRLGNEDASWAAARVATIDLARIKESAATGRPVTVSASEQRLEWEQRLLSLPPRHAVLRLGERTSEFLTLGIPNPSCSPAQLQAIKDEYAKRLMVPVWQIEREMQGSLVGIVEGTLRETTASSELPAGGLLAAPHPSPKSKRRPLLGRREPLPKPPDG